MTRGVRLREIRRVCGESRKVADKERREEKKEGTQKGETTDTRSRIGIEEQKTGITTRSELPQPLHQPCSSPLPPRRLILSLNHIIGVVSFVLGLKVFIIMSSTIPLRSGSGVRRRPPDSALMGRMVQAKSKTESGSGPARGCGR